MERQDSCSSIPLVSAAVLEERAHSARSRMVYHDVDSNLCDVEMLRPQLLRFVDHSVHSQ